MLVREAALEIILHTHQQHMLFEIQAKFEINRANHGYMLTESTEN